MRKIRGREREREREREQKERKLDEGNERVNGNCL